MRGAITTSLFAGLLLAALAAGARAQLTHTDPKHYSTGVGQSVAPLTNGRGAPDFKTYNPTPRKLMEGQQSLRSSGPPDRRLTQACREGRFLQVVDQRYIARLDGHVYGAGIGGRSMLHDPQRMAQSGVLYVFVGQGTTNCRVYMLGVPGAG